jgi:hypothetical protein
MKLAQRLAFVVLLGAISRGASAWVIEVCDGPFQDADKIQWLADPTLRASAGGFPNASAEAAALRAVVDRWNASPADFRFVLAWNDRNVGLDNGQNEVWFSQNEDILDGAPAVAFTLDDCGAAFAGNNEIVEADVVFACDTDTAGCPAGVGRDWTYGAVLANMGAYGGPDRPFRTTAMHELGHALGLKHEDEEYNIMGQDWTHLQAYGTGATAYPGEDASDGAVDLYGVDAAKGEDLSVAHWAYRDARNGYSRHQRTRILDALDVELPDYRVDAGQEIQVEFTLENNGVNDQADVRVAYYLSSNTLFGLGDRLLGRRTFDINRNSVFTPIVSLDLPADLVSGSRHYVLAVVDDDDQVDEAFENNNITFSQRIQVR